MTTAQVLNAPARLTCGRCGTTHRVQNVRKLKSGMKASCMTCGAPFLVLPMPADPLPDLTKERTIEQTGPTQPLAEADETIITDAADKSVTNETFTAQFHGAGGSLFGIHLINSLLTIATLGLYYFWAKVRVRCYLFSQTAFAGDRFSYHGTGRELLNGVVKATLVFGLPYYGLTHIGQFIDMSVIVEIGLQAAAWLLLLFFVPVAIVGARRYRLTRTSWRGIRFSFQGRAWEFMKLWFSGYLLTALSLGLYYPYFSVKKQAFLITHSFFGSEPFKFSGEGASLFRSYLKIYAAAAAAAGLAAFFAYSAAQTLPTAAMANTAEEAMAVSTLLAVIASVIIGFVVFRLLWFPYAVAEQRYFWEHTAIGHARFSLPITTWPYLKLKLVNLGLAICTMGLAWPWITIRNIRFITDRLTLTGVQNFNSVVQAYEAAPPIGEGLDGFLDTGFDLG